MSYTVGSICSGIEAASVAWIPLGFKFKWFSEIAEFPSRLLKHKYPSISNLGDMNNIPNLILSRKVTAPDIICGGTPCQAFSFAGWQNGLKDERGNLTLKFVDIVNANDAIRKQDGLPQSVVLWENVEGVLTDKTNAFGCFLSFLAGQEKPIENKKWPSSGFIYGKTRNIAWRVLDAKYFGLPQQRKRLYVLAGGKDFFPEQILFEKDLGHRVTYPKQELLFEKDGVHFEIFREYTDCLYSAYGTKWNGNAAATNGSLFVLQNNKLRRLSPLECERLMGFPDDYTNIQGAKKTSRYQVTGNSWAVPVIRWIGKRLISETDLSIDFKNSPNSFLSFTSDQTDYSCTFIGKIPVVLNGTSINGTTAPNNYSFGSMQSIVSVDSPEDIYISPVGCYGIVRRKIERNTKINPRLEKSLLEISAQMSKEEIEKRSRVQRRGQYANATEIGSLQGAYTNVTLSQMTLFDVI